MEQSQNGEPEMRELTPQEVDAQMPNYLMTDANGRATYFSTQRCTYTAGSSILDTDNANALTAQKILAVISALAKQFEHIPFVEVDGTESGYSVADAIRNFQLHPRMQVAVQPSPPEITPVKKTRRRRTAKSAK